VTSASVRRRLPSVNDAYWTWRYKDVPIPTYTGLQTALSGLQANQAAIDTTGHNIANANTTGYSRQVVDLTERYPVTIPALSGLTGAGSQLGEGVTVASINRIRDQFLDVQYRAQNTVASNANQQASLLGQLQTALAEPSDHGLQASLSTMWGAFSDFSNSSSNWPEVQGEAAGMVSTFNQIQQALQTLQDQVGQQYQTLTASPGGQVQQDAQQLSALNLQIARANAAGQSPNDLMDQRDNVIDDLSSLANVTVSQIPNSGGMLSVTFGDAATPLVDATNQVNWPQTLTTAAGGTLGALLSLNDPSGTTNPPSIQGYINTLNGLANQLVSGVVGTASGSTPLFTTTTSTSAIGTNATMLSINPAARASDFSTTDAQTIADLQNVPVGGQTTTIDNQYSNFVGQVGTDVKAAQNAQSTQAALQTAITNQRQSTSGVSLDEEMTNLITYQRGYQACARMLTTIDSTLDTLINHTGAGL
jgi:flagellar hook-associated protein 1 FlgK